MSYYIGATGEYIWEELLENTTSNVIIANNINFDAGPLTDAIQETITDALGTAVGELIAPVTEVPSATGVGVVALTALGLLSYYKLNRTAVQDVDSMVYSADYASILTPGMFDDRVRIRYDTNQFSNVFYNVDNVKKGEILTSRINLLPIGTNDVDLYTSTGKIGIGTTPLTPLHIYTGGNAATNIIRLETPIGGSSSIEFKRGTDLDIYADFRLIGYNGLFKLQYENNELAYGDTGTDIISASKTQITINKPTTLIDNVGIGTYPATQLHIYNATSPTINIQSIADGTPIVEFMRGTSSDVNKDYRFISQSDTFKLQFQDATTYYFDANNQLISINATDTIIHKQTEFKANVLIGGDTRTIGYVGIGTTAATALHVYTAAANILRLQTAPVNGTNSIEFMRGNSTDPLTDYRLLTDTAGKFKIQYANNLLAYGDADTDLIELSTTNTTIYKPTEFKGNVGIGTTPHATYKVDVNGTINATAFRGDGANITALNEANLVLTTTKLYNNFNQTNFAIIDNKIDITPNYSINITDYDSQTLFNTSVERKYKGKMTANYDDRNGVYKLITTNNRTDNVAVLNYKVGDKISIRNTATVANDYLLESGSRYYNSLLLIKRPNNIPLNWAVNDAHNVLLYEWFSSDGLEGRPEARVRTPTNRYFPFTTVMTFLIEAGYNYYLCKLYNSVEVSGSSLIVVASGYGDDYNDFNRAFGAGQTFKLQITGSTFADDYLPTEYIGADIGIASDRRLGGVKKGRGVAIDETTGALDATPVSVDLINSMNTSHFTNNTGTNKIDISSTYVAPSATKLATARNIAGVSFDGSGAIDIPYGNLSSIPATWGEGQIPSLPISKITNLQSTLDGKAPTSHTHVIGDVTNLQSTLDGKAPTSHTHTIANITNLQTTLDGKAPTSHSHVIADITNLQTTLDGKAPTSHTHVIGDVTNLQTTLDGKAPTSHTHVIGDVTNLQTTLDGKQATLTAGTNITITGTTISSSATFTPTSTNLISVFNATQFVNNVGTSKIDIDVNWKPTTCSIADSAMQLVSSRNIAGVAFNGTASIAIPFANIDGLTTELATKQATINSTAGQLIIGNGNGATTTNAGLTWNGGNTLNTTNLAVSTYATITRELTSVLSGGVDMFELRNNATNNLRFNQTWIGANDMRWQMIQKSNNVDYPVINFRNGKISVGTFSNPAYQLELVGDINITGAYRVNGTVLKPANAVLADTATALATSRNIAGVAFNGTADIAIDYFALTNRPIILQPTTTNLQLVSGYTLSVPGNMAVGTTAIPTNILQVGAGGRLRISNGTTDYTLLGTIDTDGSTNTSIVISGTTRSTNAGNIQYLATASGGSHIFYTASATTRMTISSSGVNVNNDLGVSGNVGIATAPSATYKLNVNGSINATSVLVNGSPVGGGLSQGMVVQMKHLTYTQMDVKNNTGWDAINDNLTTGFVIAITPTSTSSKILINMIAHIGTDPTSDSRWWGIKLYRKIGAGAWTEVTGANGTETGAAAATAGTPVWVSHNLGMEGAIYQYFIANVTGTYLDAPNTTSTVYYTAYWNQRIGDNPSVAANIYINRALNHGDAYRPAPSSSWTASEIWDLGTLYVPPTGDTTITITSGNVGIGTAPNINYKLNVGGTISAVVANPVGVVDLLNLRYDANWGLRLQQNYTGAGNIQYDFIHRYSSVDYNLLTFKGANVGIGNTNPTGTLCLGNSQLAGSDGFLLIGKNNGGGGARTQRIGYNSGFDLTIGDYGGGTGPWIEAFKLSYAAPANSLVVSGAGNVSTNYAFSCGGDKSVGGTSYQRNTYIYSGNEGSSIGLYFATPFTGSTSSATKSGIIAQAISSYSRHHLAFCLNTSASNSENVNVNDVKLRLNTGNYVEIFTNLYLFNNASYFGGFYSVSMSNTDYLCIENNTGYNTTTSNWIRVAYGSFTAFHRCYTDDVLYDEEDPDIFKNNYMGRVVIATGKIKTDFSKKKATEPNPDADTNAPPNDEQEWYSGIDKDGIAIEDAIPVVALSRNKKDKRVFGVLGAPTRNTNNKDRLIVNSIGEGAICVANTNGNIENGDYIQSSDLLGYGEKQDDDLLHNYTIGKATIDCDFQLDSPYYQCHEIENGVRIAFIACTYHCG